MTTCWLCCPNVGPGDATQAGVAERRILLFSMGRFQFQCVLAEAGPRFTMFLRDGTPVRSTVSVRFLEYVRLDVQIQSGLFFGSPTVSALATAAIQAGLRLIPGAPTIHTVVQGDTLSGLAGAFLGDPAQWRLIAQANKIDDPLDLPPGKQLVIPSRGPNQPSRPGGGGA